MRELMVQQWVTVDNIAAEEDGGLSFGEYVVVPSEGGAEEDPAWSMNLEADPSVGVQVRTRRFTARARVASAGERAALWAQMVNTFPLYDDYAQKTDREIPIVLLTPLDGPRQDEAAVRDRLMRGTTPAAPHRQNRWPTRWAPWGSNPQPAD